MSGGGNKVARGRMSSKSLVDVSPTQLVQLEEKLKIDESKAEACLKQYCFKLSLSLPPGAPT